MSQSLAIGIDLGGTNLKAAVVNRHAQIVARSSQSTDAARGPESVITDMVALVERLLRENEISRERIIGVGVGSPGPLSVRHGLIYHCANLPGWNHVPLRQELAERLACRVVLENDANAAAYGEFWAETCRAQLRQQTPDRHDLVMLTLGTGVGAGVILGGRVFRGHFENAAELGHMIVVPHGLRCPCGQYGCLEQYASASAIARRALGAVRAGSASALKAMATGDREVHAHDIAALAEAGDELCRRIWDEACYYLAIACINIQHTYNPARVVLGGGLALAGEFLISGLRSHFEAQQWSLCRDFPTITLAALGVDAGSIGAAGLVFAEET